MEQCEEQFDWPTVLGVAVVVLLLLAVVYTPFYWRG